MKADLLQFEKKPGKESGAGDFPGGLVIKTQRFQCKGVGSIPGQGK